MNDCDLDLDIAWLVSHRFELDFDNPFPLIVNLSLSKLMDIKTTESFLLFWTNLNSDASGQTFLTN